MKIGMMGGWNTDSGASFHAELIGRSWVEQGHDLKVFTFYEHAFHGTQITGKDEDYVTRCFTVSGYDMQELDPVPFLTENYDIFVAQDIGMLPKDLLAKIYPMIKKKAKTINVVHDGKLSEDPSFYQFEWDAIVSFDERYKKFLAKAHDPKKIHIIPYPSLSVAKGDKMISREKLDLQKDKKILFGFGPASKFLLELVEPIAEISKHYPILLLIISKDKNILREFEEKKDILDIKLIEKVLDIEEVYAYLHASDVLVFNKSSAGHVVVSSTALQCMGSLCPIIAKDSNYVEYYDREVLKYTNEDEFKNRLRSVFEEDDEYKTTIKAAEEYVTKNSHKEVAKRFIKLANSLL